jgi:hypothetical protein
MWCGSPPLHSAALWCAGVFKKSVKFELSELHIDTGNRTFIFSCSDKDMDALRRALVGGAQSRL